MDTSLQESGGRHSLAGLRGKRDGASIGTRACCAGKEGRSGSRHPVPVHFCRELAGATQTRVPRVRGSVAPWYTPAPSLHARTKLGADGYREAPPRYTPAPSSRAGRKLAPHVYGGHAPPVHVWQKRTGSRKLGRDVYPARYTSAASLHGPVKLGRDVYGRVDSGLTCTGGRRPNALLTESAMGAKPAIIRQGRVYAFAQVRPRVVACQFDVIPH